MKTNIKLNKVFLIFFIISPIVVLFAQPEFVSARIVKMEAFDFDFTDDYRIFIYVDSSFNDTMYLFYEKIIWFEYDPNINKWNVFHNGIAWAHVYETHYVDFISDIDISRKDSLILMIRNTGLGPEGTGKSLWRNNEFIRDAGYFGGNGLRNNDTKFDSVNDSTIYLACAWAAPETGFLRSLDNGITWISIFDTTALSPWYPMVHTQDIKISQFDNTNIILSGFIQKENGDELSFIATKDYGSTWYENPNELFTVNDFEFIPIDTVIFLTDNGRYISSDGGANPVFYDSIFSNVSYYDMEDNQYYFSIDKTLMISYEKGLTYSTLTDSLDSQIIDVYGVKNSDSVYICTEKAVYIYYDLVLDTIYALMDDSLNVISEINIPENIILGQNYPNPFNPKTIISYNLNNSNFVELIVFDLLGRKVKTLVNKTQTAGTYIAKWDGTDFNGVDVPSGIYFYRLTKDYFTETKKMILLR